jgi:proline iminopeptidase
MAEPSWSVHEVDVDGCRLVVEVTGPEGAPLLITHHGAPGLGTREEPKRAFGALAADMRVLAFDARGSGASDERPPFSHARWVADVDALRAWAGADRVTLAGGSYGGFIAMEYAIRHPDRVRAVVLRDTSAHSGFDVAARKVAMASSRTTIDPAMFDRIFDGRVHDDADLAECWRMLVPLYDHDDDPAKVEARLAATEYHAATHNAAFAECMPRYDLRAALPALSMPVLVTVGRADWITPVGAAEEIVALIPDARLEIFENSGHSPQLEEPERFIAVVRGFLRDAGVLAGRP